MCDEEWKVEVALLAVAVKPVNYGPQVLSLNLENGC
jgi:hypothetical protein